MSQVGLFVVLVYWSQSYALESWLPKPETSFPIYPFLPMSFFFLENLVIVPIFEKKIVNRHNFNVFNFL